MPYRRRKIRQVKRRRRRGRRSWYNRKYSVKQIAYKAWKAAKYLKGLVNVEFKHHDVDTAFASVTTTWLTDGLTEIAQGDTDETRDGDTVRLKSLAMNVRFSNVDADATQLLRFIIVVDNSDMENTAPVIADIIDGAATDLEAFREIDSANAKLYHVIYDRIFVLPQNGQPGSKLYKKLFFKLDNICKWSSGTATDFKAGHFFVFLSSTTATASEVSCTYRARFRYIDN